MDDPAKYETFFNNVTNEFILQVKIKYFREDSWNREGGGKEKPAVGWPRCHQIWDNAKISKQSFLESFWEQKKDLRYHWVAVLLDTEGVWTEPQHIAVSSYYVLLFKINRLTTHDSDLYRCFAVNEYGEAACSAGLRIIQGRTDRLCAPKVLWSQVAGFAVLWGWVPRALSKYPWCECLVFHSLRTGGLPWLPPLWWFHDSLSFKTREKKVVLWSLHWTIIRSSGFSVELAQSFLHYVGWNSLLGGIHLTSLQMSMLSTWLSPLVPLIVSGEKWALGG